MTIRMVIDTVAMLVLVESMQSSHFEHVAMVSVATVQYHVPPW